MDQICERPNGVELRFKDYVLTTKEAAQLLSLSERTVTRLIAASRLNAVAVSTRRKGILASEISRYLGKKESASVRELISITERRPAKAD